jgi:hypothetical protein
MWYFFSPVGTFIIAIEPDGAFGLWIDTQKLDTYAAPEEAAGAVRSQHSGYAPWDELVDPDVPKTLAEWIMMPGTAL